MSDPKEPPSGRRDGKFQPGRSGNPKGRPRKSGTIGEAVRDALAAKVVINEGGKRKRITKRDAASTWLKGPKTERRSGPLPNT